MCVVGVPCSPYALHATSDICVVPITVVNAPRDKKQQIGTEIYQINRNQKVIGDHEFLHFYHRDVPDEVC